MIGAEHVRATAAECASFLAGHTERDWSAAVPDLEMSVVEVVAHAAEGCLWYAIDLAAGGTDLTPVEHRVKTDSEPAVIIETVIAYADVVAAVIDAAPAGARGFHPMGSADPSGFAAMACDEMLIHTDDAARGFGVRFEPSGGLTELVLARLFPWITSDGDAWELLQWANGRRTLGERPRLAGWSWHCAPIEEWDGTTPAPRSVS